MPWPSVCTRTPLQLCCHSLECALQVISAYVLNLIPNFGPSTKAKPEKSSLKARSTVRGILVRGYGRGIEYIHMHASISLFRM